MSIRHFINLVESSLELDEKYSKSNVALLRYMQDREFDPYPNWDLICTYLEKADLLDEMSIILGRDIESSEDLEEEDPEVFYKLPKDVQQNIAEYVINYLMRHSPEEAPTWSLMGLNQQKLLPRTTWLVHFSDHANAIWKQGFTRGVGRIDNLGLTRYLSDREKEYGGYNFAFIATSSDAKWAAEQGKYGEDAVLFQNSGVIAYHYGDEESQVMFDGSNVDHRNIVFLQRYYDEFIVRTRKGRDELFRGDYETVVKWVIANADTYRRLLFGR